MRFTIDNKQISITKINERLNFFAQPTYDISIRSKETTTNDGKLTEVVKKAILTDYTTDTPKYKVEKEIAQLLTNICIEYKENNRSDLHKISNKILNVLTYDDIKSIGKQIISK